MPTEVTIKAYKYSELDGRAKEKAHAKLVEWITDHEWWDYVYEQAKIDGEKKGFGLDDIRFSGFWSQGDGAYWTGHVDMPEFIEQNLDERSAWYGEDVILLALWRETGQWIDKWLTINNHQYRYSHSNGMVIGEYPNHVLENLDPDDDATLKQGALQGANIYELTQSFDYEARITEWCDEALTQARAFADEIYRRLENEYNHLTSEESLNDFADANEYLFDERGVML